MPARKGAQAPNRKPVDPQPLAKERSVAQSLLHLRKLKRAQEEINKKAKAASALHAEYANYVFDRLEYEGLGSTKADGTNFVVVSTPKGQVVDKGAFLDWAKAEAPDLFRETVAEGELNALVKRCLDDGVELPPGVNVYFRNSISQRAA